MRDEILNIRKFLIEYAKNASADGYIIGISGGVDSSVLYKILEPIKEIKLMAVMLPIHSLESDEDHARLLVKGNEENVLKVDLTSVYDDMVKVLPRSDHKMSYANIKPRLRMTALYQMAQSNNLLVAGATNKIEYMIGYFTKHGDSGVDVMPLAEYSKREIYEMARILGVSDEIILKPPSAGLYEGQSDEKEIGVTYDEIEESLNGTNKDEKINTIVNKMVKNSQHKRDLIPIYKRKED